MEKPQQDDRFGSRSDNPSFSSSLLDLIYRSIDESNGRGEDHDLVFYGETMKMKKHRRDFPYGVAAEDRSSVVHRRSLAADFERSRARKGANSFFFNNSSSSSSDSSGFSSSESDSLYLRSRSSHSPPEIRTPRPIRTSVERYERSPRLHLSGVQKHNKQQELGSFLRTKSRALKIYSDLKKVKQPISPGGKLASFLNSLFTAGNTKKPKKMKNTSTTTPKEQAPSSTCSSASSFSRSCLSKAPSSSGKSKRSVRFCPVSVIVDEDCKPCGHKKLYEDLDYGFNYNREEPENRRVIEAAKELLRNYHKKKDEFDSLRDVTNISNCEDEEDEDDAMSCASSDLFELDNLSAIGIERYREELPVYETTRLGNTRAIASGLIL